MGNAATGIVAILVAFPVYLLWKGRLPLYLALTKNAAAPSTPSGTTTTPPASAAPAPTLSPVWSPGLTYGAVTQPNGAVEYGYGTQAQFQ